MIKARAGGVALALALCGTAFVAMPLASLPNNQAKVARVGTVKHGAFLGRKGTWEAMLEHGNYRVTGPVHAVDATAE